MTARAALVAGVVGAALLLPATANAAVTIGSDLASSSANANACSTPACTLANTALSGGAQVTSPIDGVVVRWRIRPIIAPAGAPVGLKVIRPAGGGAFTAVSASSEVTPMVNSDTVLTYLTRQPIAAGDGIALDTASSLLVTAPPAAGNTWLRWAPQLGVGQTRAPDNQSSNSLEVLVNADIEPDADKDGFGDETQDPCPTEAGPDTGCDPPETSITKGPKDKTRNKKAVFEFSSDEPGSTFECSLDSAAFSSCASGQVFKVRRGKHTLQVRATDAVGNVDGSPASDDWKVKRKRRK